MDGIYGIMPTWYISQCDIGRDSFVWELFVWRDEYIGQYYWPCCYCEEVTLLVKKGYLN